MFEGHAAGPQYNQAGGGSNFLCLHEEPQWDKYRDGQQQPTGSIYGVEYEMFSYGVHINSVFSEINNGGHPIAQNPAPCAVCYVQRRSTVLMIPARKQCPNGWTTEYGGYLVSQFQGPRNDRKRSSYICWDKAPEVTDGNRSQNQALIYPVQVQCGSLPCSKYTSGRELTCVVCSK